MTKARNAGFEHGPIAANSGGAHRCEGNPVIGPDAAYYLGLFGSSPGLPVPPGKLDAAVGGFTTARGKIKVINARVTEIRQTPGEFDSRPVRSTGITRTICQFTHLMGGRIGQFLTAVARGYIPKAGQAIDQAIAIGVKQIRTLASHPYPAAGVARGMV